ncbi:hypothetical protein MVEN_00725700 [Mycena venus]|uniref:Uncharacterized protein n=1 Tax=Mycena venus TaxID=2733690 RepID=A0A8H6YJ11_9AGAR|nr:hypothetical protein MVEN_00725700 [Mycena venus]
MPAFLTETSTHASRNPSKRVQLSTRRRGRPSGKLTESQKATRALQAAQRKIKKKALYDHVDEFYAIKKKYIADIVKDHDHTEEYATRILSNTTQYKHTREISLRNAIVHDLHKQARDRGETISLKELATAADEAAHLPRSKEVARLKAQLQEKRVLARVGLRANNLSAGADSRAIVNRIQDEIMNLHTRTGTRCVALFTRGNVDDQFIPTYAESGGSFDFFIQSLKIAGLDVLRLFEQWSCTQDQAPQRDSVVRLKSEITQTLNSGLHRMTKNKRLKMSYTNFDTDIKLAWKVKLVGWPDDIPFVKPSDLGSSDRVRRICSMVRSSQIHWVYLELDEIAELEADIERRRAAGTLHKARKPRADKGKKHKSTRRHRDDDEDGDEDDEGDASDSDHDDPNESDEDDAPRPTSSTHRAAPAPQSSSHRAPEAPPAQSSSHQAAPSASATATPMTSTSTAPNPLSNMSDADFNRLFPLDFENLDFSNIPTVDFASLVSGFGSGGAASNDVFTIPSGPGLANSAGESLPSAAAMGIVNAWDGISISDPALSALAPNASSGASILSSTGTTANGSSASTTIRFRAPATPNTLPGQKRKKPAGARDGAPAAKRLRQTEGSQGTTGSASEKPKRKARSDKGKPREKAAAARLALENETPEQREARLAAKKAAALRKIQARMA